MVNRETVRRAHPFPDSAVKSYLAAGYSLGDIAKLEIEIISDVLFMRCWEVSRKVPVSLCEQLEKVGRGDEILHHWIVPVPNASDNARICEKLLSHFSARQLLGCPGFVLSNSRIRIDLDARHAYEGFIIPITWERGLRELRVFRHPGDNRPFALHSRA